MQYAKDTEMLMHGLHLLDSSGEKDSDLHQLHQIQAKKEALESSTGILELGLGEFPGCSLLHLFYLESLGEYLFQTENEALHHLIQSESEEGDESDSLIARGKLSRALENASKSVGRGSHVNEGMIVSEIFRFHSSFLLTCLSFEVRDLSSSEQNVMDTDEDNISNIIQQISSLSSQWSKTPMGDGFNDEVVDDLITLWDQALSILTEAKDGEHAQMLNQQKSALMGALDDNRRSTGSLTNVLSSYENEIDVAMTNEGIFFPRQLLQRQDNPTTDNGTSALGKHLQLMKREDSKWDEIILGKGNSWLLGLGASETSHAFAKYTSFLQRSYQSLSKRNAADNHSSLQEHIAEHGSSMISCVYERAIAECPTVESLWVSYIKFLRGEWVCIRNKQEPTYDDELHGLANVLQLISQRSVRNCPYSSNLFELRMTTLGLVSTSNLEPDDITAVIQEATQLGFLNGNREAILSMRLVAINVVKRKLLSLVSRGTTSSLDGGSDEAGLGGKDYDAEDELVINTSNRKKTKANAVQYNSLSPAIVEEVEDLIEDIRDMYEETDNYLFKSHSKWDEGKVCFWRHRCMTEAYILGPIAFGLRNVIDNEKEAHKLGDEESLMSFEKLVKSQKPSHPDSWREYLRYVSTSHLHFMLDDSSQVSPGLVGTTPADLRQTRGLYKRAMSSVRKAGKTTNAMIGFGIGIQNSLLQRDYDLALHDLCHDYVEFEKNFGSEESLSTALALVKSKMANFDDSALVAVATDSSESNSKRKFDSIPLDSAMNDETMLGDEDGSQGEARAKRTKVKTNLKEPKKADSVHKVRIGKMDYPAHPFTIHVSNLEQETQDMDLVDAFLSIGGIVHAKILREKLYGKGGHHFHGESKGCGLVQFEERMSVEKALEQNGKLEIKGKTAKINRSHLPAVSVVPQGMHRVNPKGEGKKSKRNQLKKKSIEGDADAEMEIGDEGTSTVNAETKNKYRNSSSPGSIKFDSLSFKPRAVKQKPKIYLGDSSKK